MLVLGTKIYKIKTGTLLQRKKNCESKGKLPKHSEDRRRGADSVNTHTGKSVIAITDSNNGLTLSLEIRQFISVLSPDSKYVFLRHHFCMSVTFSPFKNCSWWIDLSSVI